MNVSELARKLNVNPKELMEKLPQIGFDIGQKAIKIDNKVANAIIEKWPKLIRQLEAQKNFEARQATEQVEEEKDEKKIIEIPSFITVRDFANTASLPVNKILAELMKNGVFTSLNEKIDFETAAIVGSDLGLEVKLDEKQNDDKTDQSNKLKEVLKKDGLSERSPVLVVMGHVDHGKTKLLDAIRRANVVDQEHGGITQHIGAYQTKRKNKLITFIDTPGHEAFTAMRSRGAKIADIAILVVAADDGVKPQTVEAYRIIEAAKIPFVVAINKIDKPEADIDKVKQELSNQLKIMPEEWGGKIVMVPVSAKENKGIEDLLDMILLIAEINQENIKANPSASPIGTIIESRIDKGEGPVATVLIQNGTLKLGDQLIFNGKIYGRARALKNYLGENLKEAPPSTPVKVIGLKIAPKIGSIMETGEGEKMKSKSITKKSAEKLITKISESDDENIKKINLIIKSDVLGSAEAIEESLEKINTPEVKVNIISKGLGNITDSDITRAEATESKIIGFNVKTTTQAEELAREKMVEIKKYNIIYDLLHDIKEEIQNLIEPNIKRVDLGKKMVKTIFKTGAKDQIIGGKITEGKAENESMVEVERDGKLITEGKITQLQSGKEKVSLVEAGQECGIQFEGSPLIKEGDTIHLFKEEEQIKKI